MAYKAIDKKKLAQILTDHAVGMKKSTYSEKDVTDDMLKSFNDGMAEHMKKYPDFDVDLNDYTGEADDKFIENILLPTAEKGGFNLFESEGDKPEEKPGEIKDMLENAANEMAISDEAINKLYAHVQQHHQENLPELEQIIAEFIDVDKSSATGIVLMDDQRTAAGDALKAWMDGIEGMSFGEGFSVVMDTNESGYETWVENGTLDAVVKKIQDAAKGKTGDELNKIATDIINDENYHGDKKDMVQSREYILDKVKAKYIGEASREVQIDQLVDDIYDIIEDTETRGQVENIILNHFGHDLDQSKIDDVIAQLRDKGVEIYENTDASLAKDIATDLKPKLEKIRDEKGKVTVKDLEDIINAGDGNKDGKNTTTDLVMAELVNMGLDFDTSESTNTNPYTFDNFILTDGEEYSMEQDGKKSRVTFMGYDEEVPDGRGYLFDTNGKVEHFTRAEVEQMVSESEEVQPIDESQEGFGEIQDYYAIAKEALGKGLIRGLSKLHQGDGNPINYYFRFIHSGDNDTEVDVAYNTSWEGIEMTQTVNGQDSSDDISTAGFRTYLFESAEGEPEEFEINEAITSSDLQWAIKNAEILNDWYAGHVPSGETAKRLRAIVPSDHPFPDEVEKKIKELEGMSKPDSKKSSGSLYTWFTDIDTDYHHGLPDFEEANSALKRLLHEEAEGVDTELYFFSKDFDAIKDKANEIGKKLKHPFETVEGETEIGEKEPALTISMKDKSDYKIMRDGLAKAGFVGEAKPTNESSEYVEYLEDKPGEPEFEINGKKYKYVWARYPDGRRDIGAYAPSEDRVYDIEWFTANVLNESEEEHAPIAVDEAGDVSKIPTNALQATYDSYAEQMKKGNMNDAEKKNMFAIGNELSNRGIPFEKMSLKMIGTLNYHIRQGVEKDHLKKLFKDVIDADKWIDRHYDANKKKFLGESEEGAEGGMNEAEQLTDADKEILKQVDSMDREEFNKKEKAIIDRGVPVEDIRKFYTDELDAVPEASAINESAEENGDGENTEENETAQAGAAENTDESSKYKAPKHFILGEAMRLIDAHLTGKMKDEDVIRELEEYHSIYKDQTGMMFGKPVKDIAKEYADAIEFVKTGKVEGVEDRMLQINENDNIDYLELSNGETTVSLYKESGQWYEGSVIDGEKPYGWGSKTYRSYLSPEDIAGWLNKDYDGEWSVTLQENKGEKANEGYADGMMGSELDWEQFVEKMNDGEDVRSDGTRKQTFVDKDVWVDMLKNQEAYQKAYPEVIIESNDDGDVTDTAGEPVSESLIKSKDELKVGEKYLTPSGLGGAFHVEYLGVNKDGRHEFKNINKQSDFHGQLYSFDDVSVLKEIHQDGTSVYESDIQHRWGQGSTYDDKAKFDQALSYMGNKLKSFDEGDATHYQDEKGNNIGVWDNDLMQGVVYDKMNEDKASDLKADFDEFTKSKGYTEEDYENDDFFNKAEEEFVKEYPQWAKSLGHIKESVMESEEPSMTYEQCESYCQDKGIDEEDIDQLTNKLVEMDDEMELDGVFTEKQLTDAINELGIELKQNLQGGGTSAAVDDVPGSEVQDQIAKNDDNTSEEENNEPQLPGKQSDGEYNSIMKLSTQRTMEQVNESSSIGRRSRTPLPTFESFDNKGKPRLIKESNEVSMGFKDPKEFEVFKKWLKDEGKIEISGETRKDPDGKDWVVVSVPEKDLKNFYGDNYVDSIEGDFPSVIFA